MFFASFFWAFFHRSFSPSVELGGAWPPIGLKSFDPFSVPLLNRVILLSSGASVTWSHHALLDRKMRRASFRLAITVGLGVYFSAVQGVEYIAASFRIGDRAYGSTFFIATGFHGLHVVVGTALLLSTWARRRLGQIRPNHCFGFEAAAWYWHFVDVVWLFLFVWIYW